VSDPLPQVQDDPEFRSVYGRLASGGSPEARKYRRIVFNPFLGLAVVLIWGAFFGWLLTSTADKLWLFWPGFVVFAVSILGLGPFFRYHCLDCGGGGKAVNWSLHLCPRVARRIMDSRPARVRPPGAVVQGLFWLYFVAMFVYLSRPLWDGLP
jgi:hypothetical protein